MTPMHGPPTNRRKAAGCKPVGGGLGCRPRYHHALHIRLRTLPAGVLLHACRAVPRVIFPPPLPPPHPHVSTPAGDGCTIGSPGGRCMGGGEGGGRRGPAASGPQAAASRLQPSNVTCHPARSSGPASGGCGAHCLCHHFLWRCSVHPAIIYKELSIQSCHHI